MESSNPYAPPGSTVSDVVGDQADPLASRSARLVAVLLDGFLLFVCFIPDYALNIATITQQMRGNPLMVWVNLAKTGTWFYVGILGALILLAINLTLLARNGQTIGKKALGIKIVRVDGSPVTLFRSFFLRYVCNSLLKVIPVVGSFYTLADYLMIFGEARRTLHDRIADTIVIKA